jgi:hypothetical protein
MTTTSSSPFYNVLDYGATGDGTTDDTAAIAEAMTAAAPSSAPTGNTVYLPAGKYRVSSSLVVPPALTLMGAGWNTPGAQVNTFAGSWIFVEAGAGFSPVTVSGSGGAVRALGFNVPDQSTAGPPASAQPMVLVSANNALIEDICLYNPYGGIFINGGAQTAVRRIFGQPVQYGIIIDGSRDTNYIDTVHFWPYWQPTQTTVAAYQLANGIAIGLFRCDNPHFSNIFAFNYNKGLSLSSSSTGIPHKVHLMNADFDRCVTGIHVASPGSAGSAATIQMVNVTIQSPTGPGIPAGNGIWVEAAAAYAMVQALNVRVSNSGLNAVRIDADNVNFYGENISLENWRGNGGFYISSASSFAHLGVGCTPGDAPYAPRSQFRRAQLA